MESSKLTPGLCAQYCELRSYRFAGLQYRTQCFCGNHIENGQPAAAKDCHYSCPGDSSAKCGGDSEEYTYRGCYVDNVFRLLNGASMSSTKLAPVLCVYYCHSRSYQYAGLQYREQCFCSDELPQNKKVGEHECNSPCKGDSSQRCGGSRKLSVYIVSLAGNNVKI
ncbi:hypothetical protein AAG570_002532 [Ranatra chinensis]|uniref:WSC domain-containing protein n=1 Tax=Ranatra chinensis TaxID=642074 RepID=A0ABD0Y878_9HEMI